ncbi:MAG: hypothetical protein K0R41_209 [Geminicoccaceae bacterium]|jgi:4-amino-4-deoxy-L-arabinose transferase-like glycosyltransferase|nr:hypothetical protein [Solirubrobacterales bacterium]MCE3246384.1 hypothetical protein [Geminicoccaceae bacterium]
MRVPMSPDSNQIVLGRLRFSRHAAIAALAAALFIALSIWWLLYDKRVPGGGDPGRHLSLALTFGGWLRDGDIGSMFTTGAQFGDDFFYPPLVHFVGSIPSALGLQVQDWGTIAVNVVFVPMLVAGCFLVGRMTYGPLAGVLAVLFALGTPMLVNLFHVFLLDAPLTAAVALALWALLATERFSRTRMSALAGALIAVATLVKTPAPLFLAGPIAVMLIGGGWRQWRNLLIAAGAALLVAGPYYLINVDELVGTTEATTVAGNAGNTGGAGLESDSRFSLDNLSYYGWVAINVQYLVPLLALLVVGLVAAVRELRQRRHLPELVAGLVVGYLAPTLLLSIRDPRYTLPLLVYVAVLATGWIAVSRRALLAGIGAAVLAGAVIVNVGAAITDVPTVRVSAPGDRPNPGDETQPGRFTFLDGKGYVVGPPRPDPLWDRLLTAAERDGLETALILPRETPLWGTDIIGFNVLAREYDVRGELYGELPPHADLRINTWWTSDDYWVGERGLPEPCGTVEEGALAPPESDPVPLSVAVERFVDGRYERWCEF